MLKRTEPFNIRSYYHATAGETAIYPTLERDTTCDLCIIGGGITGLSAALHGAEAGLDCVLLERDRVCAGASGRNGGWMIPYNDHDPHGIAKVIGKEGAQKYWSLAHEAIAWLVELTRRHDIACDLKFGNFLAANGPGDFERIVRTSRAFTADFGMGKLTEVGPGEVGSVLGTDIYAGGLLNPAVPLVHPLKFIRGIGAAAAKRGARLFEGTEVVKFEPGRPVIVRTSSGRTVQARAVLIACNAYVGKLAPQLADRFLALYSAIVATEPLPEPLARDVFRTDVAVLETARTLLYYRLTRDRRLLFGGGSLMTSRDCARSEKILGATMAKVFPQLAGIRLDYSWGGWFGMTMLGDAPDIGMLDDNIHYAQAIPIVWATLHGRLLADYLHGQRDNLRLMHSLQVPRIPGGRFLNLPIQAATEIAGRLRALAG